MSYLLESYKNQSQTIMKALKTRQIEGFFVETKEDALAKVLELIPEQASVSWGGSLTLDQIGLKSALYKGDYQIIDRDTATNSTEKKALYLKALGCDYYLTSTNALTMDGELVNIDGNGNRVAAYAFGPEHLIVVTGMNKLVPDVESGIKRVRNIAAPPNTVRLNQKTPCAHTGFCQDCKSPDCICCSTIITRFCRDKNRIKVILVGENLGF